MPETYAIKVLDQNMQACNGGAMQYALNKTYSIHGPAKLCAHGIHLTYRPHIWQGQRYFIAKTPKVHAYMRDKSVCLTATLLAELTPTQLADYNEAEAQARETYDRAEAQALETYHKAKAQARETCHKARAQVLETYRKATAQAWETYRKAIAQALKTYDKAIAQALKTYDKATAQARETYAGTLNQYLKTICIKHATEVKT